MRARVLPGAPGHRRRPGFDGHHYCGHCSTSQFGGRPDGIGVGFSATSVACWVHYDTTVQQNEEESRPAAAWQVAGRIADDLNATILYLLADSSGLEDVITDGLCWGRVGCPTQPAPWASPHQAADRTMLWLIITCSGSATAKSAPKARPAGVITRPDRGAGHLRWLARCPAPSAALRSRPHLAQWRASMTDLTGRVLGEVRQLAFPP